MTADISGANDGIPRFNWSDVKEEHRMKVAEGTVKLGKKYYKVRVEVASQDDIASIEKQIEKYVSSHTADLPLEYLAFTFSEKNVKVVKNPDTFEGDILVEIHPSAGKEVAPNGYAGIASESLGSSAGKGEIDDSVDSPPMSTYAEAGAYEGLEGLVPGEEDFFTPVGISEEDVQKGRGILTDNGIILADSEMTATGPEKAEKLQEAAPSISKEDFQRLADFVETNRVKLTAMTKDNEEPIYLRREVTGLPLTLQVNPDGKVIIHLKSKGKQEPWFFQGSFKKCKESIDYDDPSIKYATATLSSADMSPELLAELENNEQMEGVPSAVQMISVLKYRDKADQKDKFHIIMELCKHGDINKYEGELTPKEKIGMAKNTLEFVQGAHEKGLVHRDIRMRNIFVTGDKEAKVGDYGLMVSKEDAKHGTINYSLMHPKFWVDRNNVLNDLNFGTKSDIYAAGLASALIELDWKEKDLPWAGDALSYATNLKDLRWVNAELAKDENKDNQSYIQELKQYKSALKTHRDKLVERIKVKMEAFSSTFPTDTPYRKIIKSMIDPNNWDTMPETEQLLAQLNKIPPNKGKRMRPIRIGRPLPRPQRPPPPLPAGFKLNESHEELGIIGAADDAAAGYEFAYGEAEGDDEEELPPLS